MYKGLKVFLIVLIMTMVIRVPSAIGSADAQTLTLLGRYITNTERNLKSAPLSPKYKVRAISNFREAKRSIYKGKYSSGVSYLLDVIRLVLEGTKQKLDLANECINTNPRRADETLADLNYLLFVSGEVHFVMGLCLYVIKEDKVASVTFRTILETYDNRNLLVIHKHSRRYLIKIKRRNY